MITNLIFDFDSIVTDERISNYMGPKIIAETLLELYDE